MTGCHSVLHYGIAQDAAQSAQVAQFISLMCRDCHIAEREHQGAFRLAAGKVPGLTEAAQPEANCP